MLQSDMNYFPEILECVPNFSEGRNSSVIDAVTRAAALPGVRVLHRDSHRDANRTVLTFAGEPAAVCEAAFRVTETAASLIDMSRHSGTHARIGAVDVIPLIPVRGISMAEAVTLSRQLADRIGTQLRLPVYLYAESAVCGERRRLPFLRRGEYEGLAARIASGFLPDSGPAVFNPRFGACAVGARAFMLAFNVNIPGGEDLLPRLNAIAKRLRSSGDGKTPGRLPAVQAKPWFSSDFGMCQMTANLFDYRQTGMGRFYEAVKEECAKEGLSVDGCEPVGMIPLKAFEETAAFYGCPTAAGSSESAIELTARRLNLNRCKPFIPEKSVFEFAFDAAKNDPQA